MRRAVSSRHCIEQCARARNSSVAAAPAPAARGALRLGGADTPGHCASIDIRAPARQLRQAVAPSAISLAPGADAFEALVSRAAERGARRALARIGSTSTPRISLPIYWRWRAAAARLVMRRAARIASLRASGNCSASSSARAGARAPSPSSWTAWRSALARASCWGAAACRGGHGRQCQAVSYI